MCFKSLFGLETKIFSLKARYFQQKVRSDLLDNLKVSLTTQFLKTIRFLSSKT